MPTQNKNFRVKNGLDVTGAVTATSTVSATGLAGSLLTSASPSMNGTAAAGTATVPARADHVHPTDTSRAPLNSPTFTGVPAAPTAAGGTNTTQIATTAYVRGEISSLVASAPATLDTLNELATALGNDANFSTTVTNSLALKAPLASPAFTGTPTAPTAAVNTNTTQIATTAYVRAQIAATSEPIHPFITGVI